MTDEQGQDGTINAAAPIEMQSPKAQETLRQKLTKRFSRGTGLMHNGEEVLSCDMFSAFLVNYPDYKKADAASYQGMFDSFAVSHFDLDVRTKASKQEIKKEPKAKKAPKVKKPSTDLEYNGVSVSRGSEAFKAFLSQMPTAPQMTQEQRADFFNVFMQKNPGLSVTHKARKPSEETGLTWNGKPVYKDDVSYIAISRKLNDNKEHYAQMTAVERQVFYDFERGYREEVYFGVIPTSRKALHQGVESMDVIDYQHVFGWAPEDFNSLGLKVENLVMKNGEPKKPSRFSKRFWRTDIKYGQEEREVLSSCEAYRAFRKNNKDFKGQNLLERQIAFDTFMKDNQHLKVETKADYQTRASYKIEPLAVTVVRKLKEQGVSFHKMSAEDQEQFLKFQKGLNSGRYIGHMPKTIAAMRELIDRNEKALKETSLTFKGEIVPATDDVYKTVRSSVSDHRGNYDMLKLEERQAFYNVYKAKKMGLYKGILPRSGKALADVLNQLGAEKYMEWFEQSMPDVKGFGKDVEALEKKPVKQPKLSGIRNLFSRAKSFITQPKFRPALIGAAVGSAVRFGLAFTLMSSSSIIALASVGGAVSGGIREGYSAYRTLRPKMDKETDVSVETETGPRSKAGIKAFVQSSLAKLKKTAPTKAETKTILYASLKGAVVGGVAAAAFSWAFGLILPSSWSNVSLTPVNKAGNAVANTAKTWFDTHSSLTQFNPFNGTQPVAGTLKAASDFVQDHAVSLSKDIAGGVAPTSSGAVASTGNPWEYRGVVTKPLVSVLKTGKETVNAMVGKLAKAIVEEKSSLHTVLNEKIQHGLGAVGSDVVQSVTHKVIKLPASFAGVMTEDLFHKLPVDVQELARSKTPAGIIHAAKEIETYLINEKGLGKAAKTAAFKIMEVGLDAAKNAGIENETTLQLLADKSFAELHGIGTNVNPLAAMKDALDSKGAVHGYGSKAIRYINKMRLVGPSRG